MCIVAFILFPGQREPFQSLFQLSSGKISTDDDFFIRAIRGAKELIRLKIISIDMSLLTLKYSLFENRIART